MSQRRLRIALAAGEAAGMRALRLAVDRGHDVVAVLAEPEPDAAGTTVAALARHLRLPVRDARDVRDPQFGAWLAARRVDLLLNVHSLQIAHADVVRAPSLGSYNLHPGPLPHYSGLNAQSWAIYHGERTHGVTLHRMVDDVDAGSIAFAAKFPIQPHDSALVVMSACVSHGIELLGRLLETAERGEPIPARHQEGERRWFSRGPPDGGCLDWSRSARAVVDFVRACDYAPFRSPWGHPRFTHNGKAVAVVKAKATSDVADAPPGSIRPTSGQDVLVAAVDRWVRVSRVIVDGQSLTGAEGLGSS